MLASENLFLFLILSFSDMNLPLVLFREEFIKGLFSMLERVSIAYSIDCRVYLPEIYCHFFYACVKRKASSFFFSSG